MSVKPLPTEFDMSTSFADTSDTIARGSLESATALRRVSEVVESTAFKEAGRHQTAVISQLITLASELERLARVIERDA